MLRPSFARVSERNESQEPSEMRHPLLVAGAMFGLVLSLAGGFAYANPLPALSVRSPAPALIEQAGWRRYCRLHDCSSPDYVPPAAADALAVTPDGDVVAVPLRPASCGQFHYWNGTACVDARYNRPYLGPVW
jgi:hypothetical protein